MSLIRPEARDALLKWREVGVSLALMLGGLWVFLRSGLFYGVLGVIVIGMGAGLALSAWRRLRFTRPVSAVGFVEVDEGQVSYFAPDAGGAIALSDLSRIEIRPCNGDRGWHLVQSDGQSVTIPVAAQGADGLFDVFAALPGSRPEVFLTAQSGPIPVTPQTLWRRASTHRSTAFWRP